MFKDYVVINFLSDNNRVIYGPTSESKCYGYLDGIRSKYPFSFVTSYENYWNNFRKILC